MRGSEGDSAAASGERTGDGGWNCNVVELGVDFEKEASEMRERARAPALKNPS